MLTVLAAPAAAAPPDAPRLVSRADGRSGALANRAALSPSVSGSGRYVTFCSDATNLSRKNQSVAVPTGYLRDTYRHRTVCPLPVQQPRAHLRRERHPGLGDGRRRPDGSGDLRRASPDAQGPGAARPRRRLCACPAALRVPRAELHQRHRRTRGVREGGAAVRARALGRRPPRLPDLDPAATNGVRQVYARHAHGQDDRRQPPRRCRRALGDRDAGASTSFYAGRYVAFATRARNLPHRPCSASNIVVRDMRRSTTRLIRRPERAMTAPRSRLQLASPSSRGAPSTSARGRSTSRARADDEFSGRPPSHAP